MTFKDWFKKKATREDIEKLKENHKISFEKAKKDITEIKSNLKVICLVF